MLKTLIILSKSIPAVIYCPNNKEGRLYNLLLSGGADSVCEWAVIAGIADIIILIVLCLIISTLNHFKKISQ